MFTLATCRWRRPALVRNSGRSEVRDRIAASAEPKLSPDLLISPKQPSPPPPLPREQGKEEVVEQETPPERCPVTRVRGVRLRPQPRRARSASQHPQPRRVPSPAGVNWAQPGPGSAAARGPGRPGGRGDAWSLVPGGGLPGGECWGTRPATRAQGDTRGLACRAARPVGLPRLRGSRLGVGVGGGADKG